MRDDWDSSPITDDNYPHDNSMVIGMICSCNNSNKAGRLNANGVCRTASYSSGTGDAATKCTPKSTLYLQGCPPNNPTVTGDVVSNSPSEVRGAYTMCDPNESDNNCGELIKTNTPPENQKGGVSIDCVSNAGSVGCKARTVCVVKEEDDTYLIGNVTGLEDRSCMAVQDDGNTVSKSS